MSLVKRRNLFNQRFSVGASNLFQHSFAIAMDYCIEAFDPQSGPASIDTGMSATSFVSIMENKEVFAAVQDDYADALANIVSRRKNESAKPLRTVDGEIIDKDKSYDMSTGAERMKAGTVTIMTKSNYKVIMAIKSTINVYQWTVYENDWRIFNTFLTEFRRAVITNMDRYIINEDSLNAILGKE